MRRFLAGTLGLTACALSAGLVLGQEGAAAGPDPVKKRQDSISLNVGSGGSGRLTLPGGDAIIPVDGAQLDTVTRIDAEGVPRTSVILGTGTFDVEGHGGGPNIQVNGMELIPGTAGATVEVGEDGTATITQRDGGPLVLRLGTGPDAMRVVVDAGASIQLTRSNGSVTVAVPTGSKGSVHVGSAGGWSTLGPGATAAGSINGDTPTSMTGDVQPANAPELPSGTKAPGTEEVAASIGDGGAAVLMASDGSTARAEAGASIVGRWSGDGANRHATFAATEGTVQLALRSPSTTGETPAHRFSAVDAAAGVRATVTAAGETFVVDADGGPAQFTNELPHQGPRIGVEVAAGDSLQYISGDPNKGIRYIVPAGNSAPVIFTVGTKRMAAPPGTDIQFNADGTVGVIWPSDIDPGLQLRLPQHVMKSPSGLRVPYDGLPDVTPPPNVSRSTPK